MSLSRSFVIRADSSSRLVSASSRAFANPTMNGTFSVPLRNPFSWPPPYMRGFRLIPVFL